VPFTWQSTYVRRKRIANWRLARSVVLETSSFLASATAWSSGNGMGGRPSNCSMTVRPTLGFS